LAAIRRDPTFIVLDVCGGELPKFLAPRGIAPFSFV